MKKDAALVEHFTDMLSPLGEITTRAMFGGWSFYKDGVIFAIVAEGALYLKVTDANRARHEAAGTTPFTYETANGIAKMSYHTVPENVLEHPTKLREWAREAWEGAKQAALAKKPKRKK